MGAHDRLPFCSSHNIVLSFSGQSGKNLAHLGDPEIQINNIIIYISMGSIFRNVFIFSCDPLCGTYKI